MSVQSIGPARHRAMPALAETLAADFVARGLSFSSGTKPTVPTRSHPRGERVGGVTLP